MGCKSAIAAPLEEVWIVGSSQAWRREEGDHYRGGAEERVSLTDPVGAEEVLSS